MAEPASPQSNTRKLDEILKRLEIQITVDEWNNMATVLSEVSTTMKAVEKKVIKLDEIVITGNGKEPLVQRVGNVEKMMAGITKALWIVVGAVLTTSVGIFIYLAQTHALP